MEDCYINAKEEHIEYLRDKISKSLNSKDRELLDDLLSSIEEVDSNYSTAVFITGIKYGFFMHKNFDSITEKESIIIDNILKKLSEKT